MNIEGLGRVAGRSADRAGARPRLRRSLRLQPEQLENLVVTPREPRSERAVPRKLGKVGRNVTAQIERSKQNDLSRLVYALGIRHVGEKAAATLSRHLRTMTAIVEASVEAAAGRSRHRAGGRGVDPQLRGRAEEPRAHRQAGRGRREHDEPAAAAERRGAAGRSPAKTFVVTGTLELDEPRRGRRRPSNGSGAKWRARSAEKRHIWSSAPTRAANSTRRRRSASRP